mgnify:FL=1
MSEVEELRVEVARSTAGAKALEAAVESPRADLDRARRKAEGGTE